MQSRDRWRERLHLVHQWGGREVNRDDSERKRAGLYHDEGYKVVVFLFFFSTALAFSVELRSKAKAKWLIRSE